ncbi:MAG: carboxypeptidase regulatory-like domain-containing protein [Bryobacteraceae bacterium]|nr:carboxypeptidase regulatory-like domain-containing protein [Bryobacteraceae bacterium]
MRAYIKLLAALPVAAVSLWAQAGLGSIQGTVVDSSDASIPGASVKAVQLSTNSERITTTNDTGLFTLPSLVASRYSLTISASGFKDKKIENVDLNAFQTMSMGRVSLEVGSGPSTVISVTAEQAQLVTENAVRNETVQSKQVTEMPLQGRNWSTLLKIIPGSAPRSTQAINGREAGYDGYGDFRINGKASNQTQVNLDGGSNVDHGSDSKTTVTPSLESIQEVSVLTNNFQAEYGIRAGVVINIVTKSGTNKFHGTAWDYMRNEAFNANPWDNAFFGRTNPRYRYNYFGGNLGGPIKKDKLFFFYNFENLKQDTPTIRTQLRLPTALERIGDFSQTINSDGTRPTIYMPGSQASGTPVPVPNNILPPSLVTPLGKAILAIYPEPNLKNETNNNYLSEYSKQDNRYLNTFKADYNINDRTRAYVRYSYDYQKNRDLITWMAGDRLPFTVTGWNRPDKALTANLTRTFSPTLISEFLFNWQKDFVNATSEVLPDPDAIDRVKRGLGDLPLVYNNSTILPQISGTGYQDFHFNRFPWYAKAPEMQIANTWTNTRGAHILKWGGQFILNKKDEIDSSIAKGVFDFGVNTASSFDTGYSPANVLTGSVSQFRQVSNQARKLSKFNDFHFFAQDTWKVTSKFTLDYGLRVYHIPTEFNTQPNETLDAVFVPGLWDASKSPRYYVPNPANTRTLIDPAFPNAPLPTNVFNALLFSLVPGSGDPLNGVVKLGDPRIGNAGIRNPNYLLFAPRGGFAWQAVSKTVVRGGFGWSYNRPTIGQAINTFENGLADQLDYRQTSLGSLQNTTVKRLSPRNFGAIDESSNKVPTVYDFSMSVQRELPGNMVLDVAYIGNIQRHQTLQFNLNQVLPGTSWKPEFIDPRLAGNNFAGPISATNPGPLPGSQAVDSNLMRPFRGFGSLNLITNVANARYHSLQTSLQKRYGHGLTFQFVHTYGKLITGAESVGPFNFRWKDYTGFQANEDRTHTVAINYTYDVPKLNQKLGWNNMVAKQIFEGWSIAHLMNFYSGRPLTPSFGLQYAGNTQGVANVNSIFTGSPDIGPRIVPTKNPNGDVSSIDHSFDVNAFAVPNIPDAGMGSRNYLWSAGTFSNDINISKNFRIVEGKVLELRGSFFNPFNQVRRQDQNTGATFKMRGAALNQGYYLFNNPEMQVSNLLSRSPNATSAEQYNQYRSGFGHYNMTSVMDMRRIEVGLRFRF